MYNCSSISIIEIKYKADKEDVEQVVKKADTFKKLFPEYKDYAIYLGLAGLHIDKSVEKEAIKQGVGIIKQVGKNMVISDAHLKVF
jgi:outer membrane protein assembly factor BamD (BamD/ComL family)